MRPRRDLRPPLMGVPAGLTSGAQAALPFSFLDFLRTSSL